MKNKMKKLFIISIISLLLIFSRTSVSNCESHSTPIFPTDEQTNHASKTALEWPRYNNPIHMVVVFSKFKGEAPGDSLAPEWAKYIFDNKPGSVPYYYDEISFGQIKVTGEYLPKIYELHKDASYYVRNLEEYTRDLLNLIDRDSSVDFADFDNNGPDGIPGSDDDDGIVDYIVLMPISRPLDFISKGATGSANLRLSKTYYTRDWNSKHKFIKLDRYSGCIATGSNLNQAVGLLCHEYCHSFNTPDLYDRNYTDDETDSAGIGFWGLMGQGILGWNFRGGPVAPSAYTRMLMGCIGINNSNLEDIRGVHRDIRISDAGLLNGKVYRIWISEFEYFLIEHRRNDGIYCNRTIPRNGLLIWHIYESAPGNYLEESKLCDLECADGRYSDAGYPIGKIRSAKKGGDNLDFWSHNNWYASKYGGNLGDATDVYDGIKFTSFGPRTNPNSNSKLHNKITNIEIFNIHPEGDEMVFDVNTPPFTDWSKEKYPLIGIAYHRYNNIFESSNHSAKKGNTLFMINYGQNRNADELLTIFDDSLTVDNIASLNYLDVQRIIEKRIFTDDLQQYSSRITRENLSPDEFRDEIADMGVSFQKLRSGATPNWVQKISLEFEERNQPETIELFQNYPNPFNSQTYITYNLPEAGPVTLEVFSILGQRVISIEKGFEEAGSHTILLNPEGLSSGVYLYRISGKTLSQTRKFLLIR